MTLLLRDKGRRFSFKHRPEKFDIGTSTTVPAPYGGLNLRDDITALRPNEARTLENWTPTEGEVRLRPGFSRHVGGVGTGEVKTLARFEGLTSMALIAGAGGNIYDIPDLSAEVSGATNANPVVVTTTAVHGFSNGQDVYFQDVGGMTDLNGNTYTVANVTATTLELSGVDGTAFGVFTVGGTANIESVSLGSGFTEDRWQHTLYNDRLILVNGADAPQDYDGTTLSATAWSGAGLTITDLVNVALVRNRLWFCENDEARVWYGGIGSITGTLTEFALGQIAEGGTCTAIGSWSRDSGDGQDDYTVFIMSTGEIIIYQGDPATTFVLIGKFTSERPIGRQCSFKVGGELIIITRLGLLPVSAAIGGVALNLARVDPWGKIAPGFAIDADMHASKEGWHGILKDGFVYVNVPQSEGSLSKLYVLNLRNGSWTNYTSWNVSSMAEFNNELYFGAQQSGIVNLVGGGDDDGDDITSIARCAFIVPSGSSRTNLFQGIRPKVQAEGTITGNVAVDTDYVHRTNTNPNVPVVSNPQQTPWGSEWGSEWAAATKADPTWFTIKGTGRSVAVNLRAVGQSTSLKWFATDLLFKPGGIR